MPSPKEQFSTRRDEIFVPLEKPCYLLGDEQWPDFYALLEVSRRASSAQIDNAVVEASSQLLAVNFARGQTPRLRLVEKFLPDFRLILLDTKRRARYDALLEQHERENPSAMPYADFLAGEWGESLLQKARRKARTIGERLVSTWLESPYL